MAWGGLFLSFSRPSQDQQKSCLSAAGGFNYDAPLHGASRPKSVAKLTAGDTGASDKALVERGFFVNRSRVLVGSGTTTFNHAKSALLSWKHLALGWANVEPDTPVKAGTRFCICYKELIPWVMLPLQIAYVTDGNGGNSSGHGKGCVFAYGSGTLQGHLLPDIAAPGVAILAASPNTLEFKGVPYHFASGTSMACPHISGIIAVLKSLHPEWSPAALKSAIMTTANTFDNNGMPIQANGRVPKIADPFDYGAGFVNPIMAADPGLIYDINPSDYLKFFNCMGGLGSHDNCTTIKGPVIDLNLPSIAIPNLRTSQTAVRTVTNVGDQHDAVYKAFLEPPAGIEMAVEPPELVFSKDKKDQSFKVTFKATRKVHGDYTFGSLAWHDGGSHWVRIPIAVRNVIEEIYSNIS
uniref:Peptidase S8/S53 domain-containing protein n=1 Tax=Oryza nivara TaxID=4536 RepID=A0A0E0GX91_ORYNI